MDLQTILNLTGAAILAIMGWFARQLYDAVENLREDLHQIEVDMPRSYVSKADFSDTMKEIRGIVEKIYDKLDNKADK